ncbi:TetR/AcrR family transcriptional regulator [Sedimentibacter sp. B4]|uniref:TetR/AcrR family transcriptional regulator n=1 Tax=Sedimentibacter sp. B4 TaxID=304766 RepID=UPI0002F9D218|nr:TetR/AcrR family transcriptional regulator [Sedimentibacter sp. B4]
MYNRREREIEAMRELIISAAKEIIAKEGFDNLSIRKIANKIEYSPAIIYHYFKDKDEIMNQVMKNGYMRIISAITKSADEDLKPSDKLKRISRDYIEEALSMPDEFLAAQLNQSPYALKHTSSLYRGASKEKPALTALCKCLKEIYTNLNDEQIELKSQMIVVSTFGLIVKLVIEKELDEEQRQRLIETFIEEVVCKI